MDTLDEHDVTITRHIERYIGGRGREYISIRHNSIYQRSRDDTPLFFFVTYLMDLAHMGVRSSVSEDLETIELRFNLAYWNGWDHYYTFVVHSVGI